MKQYIARSLMALIVLSGVLFIAQTCFAASSSYANYPPQYPAYVNPVYGMQVPSHPVTPTQMRTGYTRQEIRSMPMISRPSRPGHFIGNTVRRRAGVGY